MNPPNSHILHNSKANCINTVVILLLFTKCIADNVLLCIASKNKQNDFKICFYLISIQNPIGWLPLTFDLQ